MFTSGLWQTGVMKTRIVCLPPGLLQPGMTIAAAVLSPQGAVLLAAGVELDREHIDGLRRRALEAVCVSLPDTRDAATIATEQAAATARVDYIFRGDGSASRQALQAAVRTFRERQLA